MLAAIRMELRPNNEVTFAEFIKMAAVVSLGQDPGPSKIGNWFDGYKATAESQGCWMAYHKHR